MNKNTVFVCFVILSAACFSGLLVAQQHGHFAEWLSPRVLCSGPCPTAQLRSPKPTERLFSDAAVSDTHKVLSWRGWLDGSSSSAGVFGLAEDFTLSAEAALQQPYLAQSLVIITGGTAELKRRKAEEPFLSGPLPAAALAAINSGALVLEAVLGRRLYPLRLEAMPADIAQTASGAYVAWEVRSGRLLVSPALLHGSWMREEAGWLMQALGGSVWGPMIHGIKQQMAAFPTNTAQALAGLPALKTLLSGALPAAVPLAFAAAPPLWFCVLCPSVLGLAAPLAINLALNQLAGVLCDRMKLPDDQCFDILIGALAVGFVLSLASAVPIFIVCQMKACANRNATGLELQGYVSQS